jgi:two-component system chemotaxis response regulator CheB
MDISAIVAELAAHQPAAIAVGGSAGSIEALSALLPSLRPGFPLPMVVVIHVPADAEHGIAAVLARMTPLPVMDAEDKMPLQGGAVYIAPPDYHLLLERDGTLALSTDPPVYFSRPSIDVFFESAAFAFGRHSLAILLSGANADGAAGLACVRAHGGLTWVQSPASARVPQMPQEALARAEHTTLEPNDMGRILAEWGYAGA